MSKQSKSSTQEKRSASELQTPQTPFATQSSLPLSEKIKARREAEAQKNASAVKSGVGNGTPRQQVELSELGLESKPTYEKHEIVKAADLEGETFSIVGARGPITTQLGESVVFDVLVGGQVYNLWLSSNPTRLGYVEAFARRPNMEIPNLTLEKGESSRKGNPPWLIVSIVPF